MRKRENSVLTAKRISGGIFPLILFSLSSYNRCGFMSVLLRQHSIIVPEVNFIEIKLLERLFRSKCIGALREYFTKKSFSTRQDCFCLFVCLFVVVFLLFFSGGGGG